MSRLFSVLLMTVFVAACVSAPSGYHDSRSDEAKTAAFYQTMIDAEEPEVATLNLFLTRMPKGGDLHHHYSGTVYAETYLDWVGDQGWMIDACTLTILEQPASTPDCPSLTAAQVYDNDDVFRALLQRWSDKDFDNHYHEQTPPDTQFFSTFGYFGKIAHVKQAEGLRKIKQRAVDENVGYIETMLSTTGVRSDQFFDEQEAADLNQALRGDLSDAELVELFDKISQRYVTNNDFNALIQAYNANIHAYQKEFDDEQFMMRYQAYAVRVLPPLQVFSDLLAGFVAASQSPYVVGVNIVAPENHYVALDDYSLHMKMYQYLHQHYPTVNRALHAGELTLGMVRPKDLLFHIHEALDIAKAQRIGHGIDVVYERDSVALLEKLKQHAAVEINLTSNAFILGVGGQAHPYVVYAHYGVPMVISTDDSGVSRNNLTQEYRKLASTYKPDYFTVKRYVYNSIDYSFLSDGDKAEQRRRLDQRFRLFEADMAALYQTIQLN